MVKLNTPTMHSFDKSFQTSKVYEAELDKHFGQAYEITDATRNEERSGIDRFFAHRISGVRYSVEYKTDHVTPRTGNVFVETTSVDTAGKLGWAYTSMAQVLIYYIPEHEYALRADMTTIKRQLPAWTTYPEAPAWNKSRSGETYRTLGRLVPLEEFRLACVQVHEVAAPLDVMNDWREYGMAECLHELPREVCCICNGTVARLIRESA